MAINNVQAALVAAISVGVAVTSGATPANAFRIGGSVDFAPSGSMAANGTTVTALFSNSTVLPADPDFSPAGTSVNVANLPLVVTSPMTASHNGIASFISGFQYQGQSAVFDLLAGTDNIFISSVIGTMSADLTFNGVIRSATGNSLLANVTGTFSGAENIFTTDNDFSINLSATPVPTPALLPGLLGMGLGIARKRKQQSDAVA